MTNNIPAFHTFRKAHEQLIKNGFMPINLTIALIQVYKNKDYLAYVIRNCDKRYEVNVYKIQQIEP